MSRNRSFKISTTALQLKYKTHSEKAGGGIAEVQHNVEGSTQQLSKNPFIIYIGKVRQAS